MGAQPLFGLARPLLRFGSGGSMNHNFGAFVFFIALSLTAAGVSFAGWLQGDWWGALALVMAMTFGLIAVVARLQGDSRNRLAPSPT